MRKILFLSLILVVSLGICVKANSAWQEENVRRFKDGNSFLLLGTDEATGIKFWILDRISDRSQIPCGSQWGGFQNRDLYGEVLSNISVADDSKAKALVLKAVGLWVEECRAKALATRTTLSYARVLLYADRFRYDGTDAPRLLLAAQVKVSDMGFVDYRNYASQAKQAGVAEVARQRRWNEFVRKYGVQELAKEANLFSNPFLFQGKTVAVTVRFERMMTANSAVFDGGGNALFVVSSLPTGTYRTRREHDDVLAVRFMGMTEIKGIPFVESMQVPNLRFVGVHFCQDSGCRDILQ